MGTKASILIVDDNDSLCTTLSLILKRKGYAAATVKDGLEAIEKVRKNHFDMLLMDIKMPVMNGVETYRRIKEIRPESVVVMMTAYAVEDLIQEALEEGAFGVIYKPLDIEKVVALIERVRLDRQGAFILLVDDDRGTRITFKNILAKKGFSVGVAATGDEAVAMMREKEYDIVFIDMKLPTLNGLETYLAIREINPEAVAIMMTAYRQEMSELVEEALHNAAYTCLYKPLEMEVVLQLLEEICERKQEGI